LEEGGGKKVLRTHLTGVTGADRKAATLKSGDPTPGTCSANQAAWSAATCLLGSLWQAGATESESEGRHPPYAWIGLHNP